MDAAQIVNGIYKSVLGTDQSEFSPLLAPTGQDFDEPPYLTVSDGLTSGWIAKQAPKLVGLRGNNIHMFTVPNEGVGTSADGQSIVVADEAAMKDIGKAISKGTLDQYTKTLSPRQGE